MAFKTHGLLGVFLALFLWTPTLLAQSSESPYEIDWRKESQFLFTGAAFSGLSFYYKRKTKVFTPEEIATLSSRNINSFDRFTTDKYSLSAGKASDLLWSSSHIMPLLFLTNKTTRKDFKTIASLYGEVFLINSSLTYLSKNFFQRARPFVYNDAVDISKKLKPNAKTSFFSGHTSFTAANTFFVAKVFADYFPDSKWKPAVWGLAAAIPAATGYFRVAAGKHFPTDVITGYAVGAAIGILVPHWHKRKKVDQRWQFHGGLNGALIRCAF
jgi:membrane-associated phospholipid phosphatase